MKFNCLSCFSHSLSKIIKSAFSQRLLLPISGKGAHALGRRLGYASWPSRQAIQFSNVKKKQPTPLPSEIIVFS